MRMRMRAWELRQKCTAEGTVVTKFIMFSSSPVLKRTGSFSSYIASGGDKVNVARNLMETKQLSAARRRTFTRWLNLQLRSAKLSVENLEKDLASGVVLVRLLQTLSPRKKVIEK